MTLPTTWQWVSLEELIGDDSPIVYGIIQAGPEVASGVPYVRPTELVDGKIDLSALKRTSITIASKYSRSTLKAGDIVLAIVGTIGKLAIVPPELEGANITQSSARLRPPSFMPPGYLAAALQSPQLRRQFEEMEFGVAVRRLNIAHVRALRVPIAPANEQRRIIAKLDLLFEQMRSAQARLERLPALLDKLKRSILAAAFCGDLTASWRAAHPDIDSANNLLDRIRAEHRGLWELGRRKKEMRPEKASYIPIVEKDASSFPTSWCALRLLDLVDPNRGIPYGIVQTGEHVDGGVPTVRCGDIKNFNINVGELKRVASRIADDYDRTILAGDELLIAVRGTTGGVALAPRELAGGNISREVAMIPLLSHHVSSKFFMFMLAAPQAQNAIAGHVKGVAQQGINLEDLRNLVLPLPPIDEQCAIVEAVESALRFVSQLGERRAGSTARLETLERAVLGKAFRGELVEQDPSDEPASVLLERLRSMRDVQDRARGGKRSTRVSTGRAQKKSRATETRRRTEQTSKSVEG